MVVVAIIGILAAIAIPNFVRHTLKARQVEALTMLGVVKSRQYSFFASSDCFARLASTPVGVPPLSGSAWNSLPTGVVNPCQLPLPLQSMADLEIRPNQGLVRFSYACEVDAGGVEFSCNAIGDLDGDGNNSEIMMCTDNALAAGAPPTPVLGSACSFPWEIVRVSPFLY